MKDPVAGEKVIVVGAGIGGLSAGILLLLLGYRVTIVEKNPRPGGLMRSYLRGGVDCPVGVHYVGALGPADPLGKMFRILGISVEELFYPMGSSGVVDRYLFDDFVFDMPPGMDAYERNLRQACPAEGPALDILMKSLREISGQMMDPSFFLRQSDPFQNMDLLRPMGEFLDDLRASARLRALLAVPCQLIGVDLDDCPVIFHHMTVAGYLFSSWRLKEGGGRMADAFAQRFSSLGGKLILNSAVRKINLSSRKVTGISRANGEELFADAVVAAIHPKNMLNMLDPGDLRNSLRERILTLEETKGVIAVQASIDAAAHRELDYNIYRLHHDERGEITNGIFYQIRKSNVSGTNLLTIVARSFYGDWTRWENTVSGKRGADYEEKKLTIARDLLKKSEEVFGPFKNAEILDVFTPLTLRDYVNCPEGSCYGVSRSVRQLLKLASLNKLSVKGLFLAGQNAVAPGVMGCILGSFNAVRQLIGPECFNRGLSRLL
jgi:phytoene dehydrogenase-like protein